MNLRIFLKRLLLQNSYAYKCLTPISIYRPISDRYVLIVKKACEDIADNKISPTEAMQAIHNELANYNVRSTRINKEWWFKFLILINHTDNETGAFSKQFILETSDLKPNLLSFNEWLHIYNIALRFGLYELGYEIRKLASVQVLVATKNGAGSNRDLEKAIGVQIESGKNHEAVELIKEYEQKKCADTDFIYNVKILAQILDGICPSFKDSYTAENTKYKNYVNNKSIAVVAPAQTDECSGDEIDSFDRVVRINYKKSGLGCNNLYSGLRTDISYFNEEQIDVLLNNSSPILPSELQWAIFKNRVQIKCFPESTIAKRHIVAFNTALFNGSFNLIPMAIIDLLLFSPAYIKVFKTDLFLTVKIPQNYNPENPETETRNKQIFCRAEAMHDPVTQYLYLNILWRKSRLLGDNKFNEVMNLGVEGYLSEMQVIYGNDVRLNNCTKALQGIVKLTLK